jgi:hypothetical protein
MPAHQHDNYQRRVKYNDALLPKQNHVAFEGDRVTVADTGTESEVDIADAGEPLTTQRAYASYWKSQAMDTGSNAEPELDLGSLQSSASIPIDVSVVASGQIKPLADGLYSINVDISYQSAPLAANKRFGLYLYETRSPGYGVYHETGMQLLRSHATPSLSWWHGGLSLTTYLKTTDYVVLRRRLGLVAAGGSISVYTQIIRLL